MKKNKVVELPEEFFVNVNNFIKKQAKVTSLLIKYGNSEQDANEMMNEDFNHVYETSPNASNAKLAEIVSSLNTFYLGD